MLNQTIQKFKKKNIFLIVMFVIISLISSVSIVQNTHLIETAKTSSISNNIDSNFNINLTSDYFMYNQSLISLDVDSINPIVNWSYYLNDTIIESYNHTSNELYGIETLEKSVETIEYIYGIDNSSSYYENELNATDGFQINITSEEEYAEEPYHYKGVYTFRNNTIDSAPSDWSIITGIGTEAYVDELFMLHSNVLCLNDTGNSKILASKAFNNNGVEGIVEFWLLSTDTHKKSTIYLQDGSSEVIRILIDSGNMNAHDYGIPKTALYPMSSYTWYHTKIVFNITSSNFDLYINNNLVADDFGMTGSPSNINGLLLETATHDSDYQTYLDSVSPVWENNENYTYYEDDLLDLELGLTGCNLIEGIATFNFSEILDKREYLRFSNLSYSFYSNVSSDLNFSVYSLCSQNYVDFHSDSSTILKEDSAYISFMNAMLWMNGTGYVKIKFKMKKQTDWINLILDKMNLELEYYTLANNTLNHNYLLNTTEYLDGEYLLRAITYDNDSNFIEVNKSIIIDNTAPDSNIEVLSANNNIVNFDLSFSDNTTDINLNNSYIYYIDLDSGLENRIYLNDSTVDFSQSFGTQGSYTFNIHIEDLVGNTYSNSHVLLIQFPTIIEYIPISVSVSYPSILQIDSAGDIEINVCNITSFILYENGINIYDHNANPMVNCSEHSIQINKSSIQTLSYLFEYNTSFSINDNLNFTIEIVDISTIINTTINKTIIQTQYFTISYPNALPLNSLGSIEINIHNIDYYEVYLNGSLIFNKTIDFEFLIISEIVKTEGYEIRFYTLDSQILIVEFTIEFDDYVNPESPQSPLNFILSLFGLLAIGAVVAVPLYTRRSNIIIANLGDTHQIKSIWKSGKNYAKKNQLDIAQLQREHGENWYKEFTKTSDGEAFENQIKTIGCNTNFAEQPCNLTGEKKRKKLRQILKAGMENNKSKLSKEVRKIPRSQMRK